MKAYHSKDISIPAGLNPVKAQPPMDIPESRLEASNYPFNEAGKLIDVLLKENLKLEDENLNMKIQDRAKDTLIEKKDREIRRLEAL